MITPLHIADTLGRRKIADALDVGVKAVSNAVARDKQFPSAWFITLSRMCAAEGIDCPPEIFGFKGLQAGPSQTVKSGDAA